MTADWTGEGLIRAKPKAGERGKETRRIISTVWHQERRKKGEPTPAAKNHGRFTKRLFGGGSRDGAV